MLRIQSLFHYDFENRSIDPRASELRHQGQLTDDAMDNGDATPADHAWKGIELCRNGDWNEGLYWLSLAAEAGESSELPALFYAYFGHGVARSQRQLQQAVELCSRAVALDMYQPEGYFFLAKTHLLAGDRRAAFGVVERGLQVDSAHPGLNELKADLGERWPPVIPFLPRRNPLNRWLGMARHRLFRRSQGSSSTQR